MRNGMKNPVGDGVRCVWKGVFLPPQKGDGEGADAAYRNSQREFFVAMAGCLDSTEDTACTNARRQQDAAHPLDESQPNDFFLQFAAVFRFGAGLFNDEINDVRAELVQTLQGVDVKHRAVQLGMGNAQFVALRVSGFNAGILVRHRLCRFGS